jgi:NitT/TauT family transport system permease protein
VPAFLCVWWGIAEAGFLNPALFPPPQAAFIALVEMLGSGELLLDITATMRRVVVGYALGSSLGIIVGILTARVTAINQTVGQLIQVLRPIPPISLVPLAVVWLGLGELSKTSIIMWGVFFPVWVSTHVGVSGISKELIWAAQSLGAGGSRVLMRVVLPASLRYVVSGMRVAIAIAFICVVVAEMAGALEGLGYKINKSYVVFRVDRMLADLVVLGLLGALSDVGFAKLVNRLMPWYRL